MEPEPAKLTKKSASETPSAPTSVNAPPSVTVGAPSQVLDFNVSTFSIKAALYSSNKICLSAYSETEGRMLEAMVQNDDLA